MAIFTKETRSTAAPQSKFVGSWLQHQRCRSGKYACRKRHRWPIRSRGATGAVCPEPPVKGAPKQVLTSSNNIIHIPVQLLYGVHFALLLISSQPASFFFFASRLCSVCCWRKFHTDSLTWLLHSLLAKASYIILSETVEQRQQLASIILCLCTVAMHARKEASEASRTHFSACKISAFLGVCPLHNGLPFWICPGISLGGPALDVR